MSAGEITRLRRHGKDPKILQRSGRVVAAQSKLRTSPERLSQAAGRLLSCDRDDIGVAVARPPVLAGLQDLDAGESGLDEFGQKRLF